MTNEEVVLDLLLKYVSDWNCASSDEYPLFTDELGHACNDVIKLIGDKNKENTKLKAEIEQLKDDSKIIAKELVTQIREIGRLKEESEQSVKEKSEVISKIEYALNECEPIYNKCAVVPQAKPIYDLAMNYCLDLLKGQV